MEARSRLAGRRQVSRGFFSPTFSCPSPKLVLLHRAGPCSSRGAEIPRLVNTSEKEFSKRFSASIYEEGMSWEAKEFCSLARISSSLTSGVLQNPPQSFAKLDHKFSIRVYMPQVAAWP